MLALLPTLAPYVASCTLTGLALNAWLRESRRHRQTLAGLPIRIHVNGIRGKSTVTRILGGMLREAGVPTIAKCTGTAAAVVGHDGQDTPIRRRGAATILEQVEFIEKHIRPETRALVVECMALRPENQSASEHKIVRSNIGVITNVREDHQDVMGQTLPEIAQSLLNTCPENGVLVTAERDPTILRIMMQTARRRGTRLVVADPETVTDADIAGFDYVAFKDNVAIGLAIARLLGLPRTQAMRGMQQAGADPGTLRFRHFAIGNKRVTWANLFAVNDSESLVIAVNKMDRFRSPDTTVVGLLNNRADREPRVEQFARLTTQHLRFDRLAAMGAYEQAATQYLKRYGFPAEHIIGLGDSREPRLQEILKETVLEMPKPHVLLVGMVNIHTRPADLLRAYLEPHGQASLKPKPSFRRAG